MSRMTVGRELLSSFVIHSAPPPNANWSLATIFNAKRKEDIVEQLFLARLFMENPMLDALTAGETPVF